MSFNIKSNQRRDIADKMLLWLKDNGIDNCTNTHETLTQCADGIDEPLFNVWKGYELLRILGRLEPNSPNGRKGFKVVDYNPLSLPATPAVPICDVRHCPILKKLKLHFPELEVNNE